MHEEEIKRELDKELGIYEEPGTNPDPDGRNMTRLVFAQLKGIARVQEGHTDQLDKVRALQKEHSAQLTELRETQAEHTATLDRHTETLDRHTETLDRHTETLDRHTEILDRHTETLDRILLKLDDVTAAASHQSWDEFKVAATLDGIDRQLRDLRGRPHNGWSQVDGKVDRILVHLGIGQGE